MRSFFIALCFALAGCAATGPGIEPQQTASLQKGKSTFDDVVRRFGRPSLNSRNMDGTRTAIYLQPGNDEPGAVVSLMTVVAGMPTANRESVTFEFDISNVLTDYRWTQSNPAAAATPAVPSASGVSTPANSAQPAHTAAKPASAGAVNAGAAARPAPAKKRDDGLPGWLPSSAYDPRDPFK